MTRTPTVVYIPPGPRSISIGAGYGRTATKRDSDVWESEPSSALHDWRQEAIALASHAQHLTRNCWKAQVSLSLPRMRPAAGEFERVEFCPTISSFSLSLLLAACSQSWHNAFHSRTSRPERWTHSIRHHLDGAGSSTEPGGCSAFDETSFTPKTSSPASSSILPMSDHPQS